MLVGQLRHGGTGCSTCRFSGSFSVCPVREGANLYEVSFPEIRLDSAPCICESINGTRSTGYPCNFAPNHPRVLATVFCPKAL